MHTNFASSVEKLRKMINEENRLEVTMEYFKDNFAENLEFLQLGRPKQNPEVLDVLHSAVRSAYGDDLELTYSKLIYVKEFKMYHGPSQFGKVLTTMFFFPELSLGMGTLADGVNGKAVNIRLTGISQDQGAVSAHPAEVAPD